MTTPVYTRADWTPGDPFPPEVAAQVATAIIGGAPFANSLAHDITRRGGGRVYPVIDTVTGSAWVAEGEPIPDLGLTMHSLVVATCKLGGIVILSREMVEDSGDWSPQSETARVVRDSFSRDLDVGLLHGDGTPPNPQGVLEIAATASGEDLLEAVAAAYGSIGEAGGQPTHVALSPTEYIELAASRTDIGQPIYPAGLTTILGLIPVQVPGLSTPIVYDREQVRLVVARDFTVTPSIDYSPAYQQDSIALRITGRFAVALPVPGKGLWI